MPRSAGAGLLAAILLIFVVVGGAQAQPQVAWLGIQDRDDMSGAAAAALDGAIGSALAAALAPRLTVEIATAQAPQTRRALQELNLAPAGASNPLGDAEARALGLALGAKVTIRAWAEVVGDNARLTTFAAAVHRRQAIVHQERASAPPEEAARLLPWAEGLARGIAARIAPSIAELIRDAPDSAPAFAAAADEFLKQGALKIAALEFDRAIALAPKEAAYYLGSARAYIALGELPRARRQLDIALELKPFMGEAWFELGRLNLAAGDAPAAIREFNRAIELGAGDEARMSLAGALAKTGDLKGAQEQYQAVAQNDPANTEAAKRAAEIAAAIASPGQVEVLSEAAQLASDSYAVRRKLLQAYVERGDAVEAFHQVRQLFESRGEPVNLEPSEYVQIARLMDQEADAILQQAQRDWEDMRRGATTREQVTDSTKGLHQRSGALARAAEALAAPAALERGYRHRVLAYNLLNQSDFALLRCLERREDSYYDEAVIARQASVAELERAWDFDARAGWPTGTAAER